MNKVKIFFAIATLFIVGVFWVNMRNGMAEERCRMGGGQWSSSDNTCE